MDLVDGARLEREVGVVDESTFCHMVKFWSNFIIYLSLYIIIDLADGAQLEREVGVVDESAFYHVVKFWSYLSHCLSLCMIMDLVDGAQLEREVGVVDEAARQLGQQRLHRVPEVVEPADRNIIM